MQTPAAFIRIICKNSRKISILVTAKPKGQAAAYFGKDDIFHLT